VDATPKINEHDPFNCHPFNCPEKATIAQARITISASGDHSPFNANEGTVQSARRIAAYVAFIQPSCNANASKTYYVTYVSVGARMCFCTSPSRQASCINNHNQKGRAMHTFTRAVGFVAAVAIISSAPLASAAVIDNVLTQWRQQANKCQDGAVQFVHAPMHVAMFEAINAITPKYTPYLKTLEVERGASLAAAASAAGHGVLTALCPDQARIFNDALAEAMKEITDPVARDAGTKVGQAAAAAVLAARAKSGADVKDPVFPPPAAERYASTIRQVGWSLARQQPWVLRRADEVRPAPPPSSSSATWARDLDEVKQLGAKKSKTRTTVQTDSARFWAPRNTRIVLDQLIGRPGRTLVDDARFLALAEMAHSDAYVAMMDGKYHYMLWRPITAIRHAATAPEPNWEGLGETPLHPEYPCGHCLSAASTAAVIEREFGSAVPPLVLQAEGFLTRRFDTPRAYADDVSQSRIWLGVHYRFSVDVGIAMGVSIGNMAVDRYFTPLRK
jgi:hypothetical protein